MKKGAYEKYALLCFPIYAIGGIVNGPFGLAIVSIGIAWVLFVWRMTE